jgi:hypothetical protein
MSNLRRFILVVVVAAAALLFYPHAGYSHEPITTKVMFNKEVIRILERNCLGCHAPGRIKADIPLTTYEEARPWAKAIKEEVLEKRMMPYQAVKGYGSFQHDYTLPQRDIELLVSWIEGGAPRGESKDYPTASIAELIAGNHWLLGQPDQILQATSVNQRANSADNPGIEGEYETRCLEFRLGATEDRWIKAIDFQPGAAGIHSATFSVQAPRAVKASQAIKQVTSDACGQSSMPLGNWVPGQNVDRLPNGAALRLPAGAHITARIVYRKDDSATTLDRSRLALYYATEPVSKTARTIIIKAPATVVPPNVANHRVRAIHVINEATEAVAIRPLLFPFAKSVEVAAHRPDGTVEVLIWAQNYHFDWQPNYFFKKPVALPKGTRLEVTAYLDNSENNTDHPRDAAKPLAFADALCELTLTQEAALKSAFNR